MKPTVKQIKEVLRTQNRTAIFKIHNHYLKAGGATTSVYAFICEYAPNQTVRGNAYRIAFWGKHEKHIDLKPLNQPVQDVIHYAKEQAKKGLNSYTKVLIEGNTSIYWASPVYQHSDYNKSRALENNEKNREVMRVVNNYLAAKGLKTV
jgi:hypothetical protein